MKFFISPRTKLSLIGSLIFSPVKTLRELKSRRRAEGPGEQVVIPFSNDYDSVGKKPFIYISFEDSYYILHYEDVEEGFSYLYRRKNAIKSKGIAFDNAEWNILYYKNK